ncbi:MAG: hypothetical protein GXO92_07740 [FCB group bacterium]|nr:hypothetical protein [FCB group bacterium]
MKTVHRVIMALLIISLLAGITWVMYSAGTYYLATIQERPRLAQHKLWKPGGVFGHGLGIIGGSGMIIMFIYSLRKRIRRFRRWGRLQTWLNYHIFLGIAGPILVTFHTAFKFGGLVSVSYWSMVAVALSGFIGRYIYTKIPRRVSGKELTLQEFEERDHEMKENLKREFNISGETMRLIDKITGAEKIQRRGLLGIFTILSLDMVDWFAQRKLFKQITTSTSIPESQLKAFRRLLKKRVKTARQIAFWKAAHDLFHYWHVIHKPFAYTMIIIMIIHVITAITFGYTWIL